MYFNLYLATHTGDISSRTHLFKTSEEIAKGDSYLLSFPYHVVSLFKRHDTIPETQSHF